MPERVDGPSSPPLRLGVIAIYLLLEWVIIAALDRNVVGAVRRSASDWPPALADHGDPGLSARRRADGG
jgi:hypothetical protein